MFDEVLIESAGKDRKRGGWVTGAISLVLHLIVVGAILAAGKYIKDNPEVIERPISAFVVTAAAPPPPPPPPPASNPGSSTPKQKVETPADSVREQFRQPSDTPRDVPQVADVPTDDAGGEVEGGVVGGVRGGVAGGVVGGTVGGVVGGTIGGTVGGEVGGTPGAPLRVGGNVKAPTIVERVTPRYTEIARRARIQGQVIIEAIINEQGEVVDARVIKGLPMGLESEALAALKRWKFKPGTLNGRPVPVYFNLAINFQLQS